MMRLSIKEIYQAYAKCHKGKAKSVNAQKYSVGLFDNIFNTQLVLQQNSYTPKPYTCFVATNGTKPRKIFATDFSYRLVHYYLVPKLEKIINHKFINYSCASQKGKGTHFGVNALQKMMRQNQGTGCCFLQLDIHNFCDSIDKNTLLFVLAKHHKLLVEKTKQFLWLKFLFYQIEVKYLSKTYNKFATKFSHQQYFFNHYFQDFIVILQKGNCFVTNVYGKQTHIKHLTNYLTQLQTQAQNYVSS